jgi:hypothetical protein
MRAVVARWANQHPMGEYSCVGPKEVAGRDDEVFVGWKCEVDSIVAEVGEET